MSRQGQHFIVIILLPERFLCDFSLFFLLLVDFLHERVVVAQGLAKLQHGVHRLADHAKLLVHLRYPVAHAEHVQVLAAHQTPQALLLFLNLTSTTSRRIHSCRILRFVHHLTNDPDAVVLEQILAGSELQLDRRLALTGKSRPSSRVSPDHSRRQRGRCCGSWQGKEACACSTSGGR